MISYKSILRLTAIGIVIIAAIAVTSSRRLVRHVTAAGTPTVYILQCAVSPNNGSDAYVTGSQVSGTPLGNLIPNSTTCAAALQLMYSSGLEQKDYYQVSGKYEGSDARISTWVFEGVVTA